MNRSLTGGWTTVERGLILPPCDVRVATVSEVYQDCVKLDDGALYLVPVKVRPVAVGQRVLAVVPWDDVAYVDTLDTREGAFISKFVHRILQAMTR